MSTILKALQRLDREKSSPGGRPLQDEVAAAASAPSRRRLPVAAIGAAMAALGLGLGASMFWLWPREKAVPELAAAPSALQGAAVAQNVPSAAVTQSVPDAVPAPPVLEAPTPAAPVASAPPPAAFSSPVAVVERPEPPPVAEPAPAMPGEGAAETDVPAASAPAPALPGDLPPYEVAARKRAARLSQPQPPPAPVARPVEVARAEPPAPVARPLERAESEPLAANALPAAPPAQPVRRKPAAQTQAQTQKLVRANVPDVFVSSTVWHPQKDRRLAKVTFAGGAAQELHEGDAIGPLVVSVIEPSGVIFLHDGVEIRRRVGAKN